MITFVTTLHAANATVATAAGGLVSDDIDVRHFTFGLPLLAALILAARAPHRVRNLLIGYAILLPFQTWGVVAEFLEDIAVGFGPGVASQTGFSAWEREAIAFAYQFGTLILPTVVPAVVWVLMHRRLLEDFAREARRLTRPRGCRAAAFNARSRPSCARARAGGARPAAPCRSSSSAARR